VPIFCHFFFFQAEDGIRVLTVTGVQTCALPISDAVLVLTEWREFVDLDPNELADIVRAKVVVDGRNCLDPRRWTDVGWRVHALEIGRASCRGRGWVWVS